MTIIGITPILNVASVPASLAWFGALGWKRGFTFNEGGLIPHAADRDGNGVATFASVCCSAKSRGAEIFLCHGGQGSRGTSLPRWPGDDQTDGVWMSWWVDSVDALDALHAECQRQGFLITMPPTNEPWGVREFHLRHPDGHMFRISAGLVSQGNDS
jgi:uncharacterized glyoxalase superfamily protein PhnB